MDSILTSIKKQLGILEEYTHFDPEIIIHINSVFSSLRQMGVGPSEMFIVKNKDDLWEDFIGNKEVLESVKTYVYLKVRLIFDPPASATIVNVFNENIKELEWRLHFSAETEGL